MGQGDGAGGLGAVMADPALAQPFRRIDQGIEFGEDSVALPRQSAQQGIAERDIA